MTVTVITPLFNCVRFLESTLDSVAAQRRGLPDGVRLEHIVIDGGSTDGSLDIVERHRGEIDKVVSEPDHGPADAINKGLRLASGDLVGWLNADDTYAPGAVRRLLETVSRKPGRALYFGRCDIIGEHGEEIRKGITRFKNAFFPFSCRPLMQTINYLSQPASFFTREAMSSAGLLRTDLKAAFDYDWTLRLWRHGGAAVIPGPRIASFRWYGGSISGTSFRRQFDEEFAIAAKDAGRFSPQTLAHWFVRCGIVAIYSRMAQR